MPKKGKEDSSKYRIFETAQFADDINIIQGKPQGKFKSKLIDYVYPQLIKCPQYGLNIKKLTNYKPETWRYRIGNYRLFYEIDETEKIIFITALDTRQDAY